MAGTLLIMAFGHAQLHRMLADGQTVRQNMEHRPVEHGAIKVKHIVLCRGLPIDGDFQYAGIHPGDGADRKHGSVKRQGYSFARELGRQDIHRIIIVTNLLSDPALNQPPPLRDGYGHQGSPGQVIPAQWAWLGISPGWYCRRSPRPGGIQAIPDTAHVLFVPEGVGMTTVS